MAITAIDNDCGCSGSGQPTGDGLLPANPYTALQYHFGMLLGVDDLETAQAYPRGKIRLHNAWLHREGVVWGLDVSFNKRRELTVKPGFALDAAGRELHLDTTACVDLGKWYDKHKKDEGFVFTPQDGTVHFDVHVVARFRACLARPVPAIADPCGCAGSDTAFSRVTETIELLLRPGKAPAKDLGYHRLRILFSLEDDDPAKYDEVRIRRETILALPTAQQPRAYLDAFREFAALDEIDLLPQVDESGVVSSLFPEDPTAVVLANVEGIVVGPAPDGASGSVLSTGDLPKLNVRIRRSHVATATIQELLCGPLFAAIAAPLRVDPPPTPRGDSTSPPPVPPSDSAHPPLVASDAPATRNDAARAPDHSTSSPSPAPVHAEVPDAGGPRVNRDGTKLTTERRASRISMPLSAPVDAASARADQFSVSMYTTKDGWTTVAIDTVTVDNTANTIALDFKVTPPKNSVIRLVARGTGAQPLLGTDFVPLAGAVGGPPGTAHDGNDFHIMLRSS